MNIEDREYMQPENETVDLIVWQEYEECSTQTNKIVNSALARVSDRTAAKLLELGLTYCR